MRKREIEKGVIKAGTVVWKKVRCYCAVTLNEDGTYGCNHEPFDRKSFYHIEFNGLAIVKLITLEDGVIPTRHRTGTADNWEDGHRKCRIPKAYVAEIIDMPEEKYSDKPNVLYAGRDLFEYKVGEVVTPDAWDNNPNYICTHGIHVFLTRKEAEAYNV